jgi:acetylornithine deacetylase/succinyl-diaminopimelate desuccinylase-like protein
MQVADQAQHILTETQRDVRLLTQPGSSVSVSVEVCREQQISYAGQEMQVQRITNAWATDPFDPLIDRSRQVLAAAGSPSRPGKWQLDRLGMGTAGATLLNEYNIPTIGYGPGHEDQAHCSDEWVDGKHVVQGVYGTAAIAHGLIGFPVCGWTTDDI